MRNGFIRPFCSTTAGTLFLYLAFAAPAAEKSNGTNNPAKPEETNTISETQQTLRSYLQLQEQLHNTLLTIERTRQEADAAAKENADAITARLRAMEQALSAQQRNEAVLLQNSNRLMLTATSVFAGLGLLAMIFAAWFLFRAMNRLAAVAAAFSSAPALGQGQTGPLLSSDPRLINLNPVEQSSSRLLGVIERLEKRVDELEHTSQVSLLADQSAIAGLSNHNIEGPKQSGAEVHPEGAASEETAASSVEPLEGIIAVLMGKGQSLLSLEKAQEAIACFDEALALNPRHAEALVKKGTALERLKRLEEALEYYNRAIAANRGMTLAYLYKGGVCNQLERFSEALECYEQALRSRPQAS